jgi:tRNA(fMet)-specific endonuclease VapC
VAASTYGRLRAALERAGAPIGPLDTLIAAHAVSLHVILVTNNEREFIRVPGLRLENWIKG